MTDPDGPRAENHPSLPFEYPLGTALKIYAARAWAILLVQAFVLMLALLAWAIAWSIYTNGVLGILGVIAGAILGLLGDAARRRAFARPVRGLWQRLWGDGLADRELPGGAHGHRAG